MFAPPIASGLPPPCPSAIEQPISKPIVSKSTTPSQLSFPNEFPYEFDSSVFASQEDETETEDEQDFLAALTRRLALSTQRISSPFLSTEVKPNVPESTPSQLGSSGARSPNGPFSQAPSPPTSPFNEEDSLKVISSAAKEVDKIKTARFDDTKPNSYANPSSSVQFFHQNAAFSPYYYYYNYWLWQTQNGHYHQSPIGAVKGVSAAPTAVKPRSTGTGVFLPQKYPNQCNSMKKEGGGCGKHQTKVVQRQNIKTDKLSGRCRLNSQACLSKNVSGSCLKEERHLLPQEWMY
ncbi:unnamed protein product [Cochlearia groenlandica]